MYLNQNFVIVVAAGQGLRMGADIKKQYLCLDKIPVLARTLMAFDCSVDIDEIILVIPEEDFEYCKEQIILPYGFKKSIHLVAGGKHRQDSVLNGLNTLQRQIKLTSDAVVLIHDGVRPFVNQGIINDCILGARKHGACIPAIKITDTVKKADENCQVEKTVPRENLYCVQTPQAFKLDVILSAFDYSKKTSFSGTDDASLVEQFGHKVIILKGSNFNIKITTPQDLVLGEFLMTQEI